MIEYWDNKTDFLTQFILKQLSLYLPDGFYCDSSIKGSISEAVDRTEKCIASMVAYRVKGFDYLISWQYSTFLYFLSNSIWHKKHTTDVSSRVFLLNKALNGIELFYEIEMPSCFFLSHTLGAVFAKASYGEYCVFHQGCTVGRKESLRPVLEAGVVMFPGSMVIGDCLIRENTVLAPGVVLVDTDTPGDCYVFNGENGRPKFKEMNKYFAAEYFKLEKR